MTFFHASSKTDLQILEPRISNHGIPLVYFSEKRENVLVYLSNAIEKYCRDTGFSYDGIWEKWGPYGFDRDGKMILEEYYPDALEETYRGVQGCIYKAEDIEDSGLVSNIPYLVTSSEPVRITGKEIVPDALEALLEAEKNGLIRIIRYEEMSEKKKIWLAETMKKEYLEAVNHPEYRYFIQARFPDAVQDFC
ncbi:MAG: hypothetical protein IKG15_02325 [Solobacterium sp.]|nr:hypothetical protein [Solobacterium sp.]